MAGTSSGYGSESRRSVGRADRSTGLLRAPLCTLITAGCLVLCASALGGPLTPPVGPVTSTPGPESRIALTTANTPGDADSVLRISQPGSYYLTGNLAGEAGKRCIEIAADNVTVDLNGFSIIGNATSTGGIIGEGIRSNVRIFNGVVRDIGNGSGILSTITTSFGWHVENVQALSNSQRGIFLPSHSTIINSLAAINGQSGLRVSTGGAILNCTSRENVGEGIIVSNSSRVESSSVYNNGLTGILGNDGVLVNNCVATNNDGAGIEVLNGGIITHCVVRSNGADGIKCNSSTRIESNTVTFSGANGISCLSNCVIKANNCASNGQTVPGAGILVSGTRTRVEDNQCTDNDFGFRVTVSLCFIVRNTAANNTTLNWDIAGSNRCLVVNSAAATAISGNSGGTSPGSTDPNANYTY